MHNRRHIVKISLASGFLAATGIRPALAQDAESTPEAGINTSNGILLNNIESLATAPDGEVAAVSWWAGGSDAYILLHNATGDELILRQGEVHALDADGNVLGSAEKANAAPYTLPSGGYGVYNASFAEDGTATDLGEPGSVAELELTIPTEDISEATGEVHNVRADSVELVDGNIVLTTTNTSEITVDYTNMGVLFFDDSSEVVGGVFELLIGAVSPDNTGTYSTFDEFLHGEATDKYLFAASGFGFA